MTAESHRRHLASAAGGGGDVAFKHGNFDYAESMYKEALQVTQELEDQRLVRASQEALSRA